MIAALSVERRSRIFQESLVEAWGRIAYAGSASPLDASERASVLQSEPAFVAADFPHGRLVARAMARMRQ
jgi:hypothetical protein